MNQEFQPHPVITSYETSRGVVRNRRLKKPVGVVDSHGYMLFTAGWKR